MEPRNSASNILWTTTAATLTIVQPGSQSLPQDELSLKTRRGYSTTIDTTERRISSSSFRALRGSWCTILGGLETSSTQFFFATSSSNRHIQMNRICGKSELIYLTIFFLFICDWHIYGNYWQETNTIMDVFTRIIRYDYWGAKKKNYLMTSF